MSSNLHDSSADNAITNFDAEPVYTRLDLTAFRSSNHVDALMSFLSNSIELKLPLSELDINPETSPALENIKVESDGIPGDTYNLFKALIGIAQASHSNMQKFLSKAKNNEPIPPDMFKEQEKIMKVGGITAFNAHHKGVHNKARFVDRSLDDLNSGIRQVFEKSEKTGFQQGQLNAVKDNVVPQVSAINPMLAPAESAGKVAVGLVAHYVSSGFDNELRELGITDKKLRQDVSMAIDTKSRLESYQCEIKVAKEKWIYVCKVIFKQDNNGENVLSQRIELAGERLLELISPIKVYLVQVYPFYESGITILREAKAFCGTVPKILQYINIIGSAKTIIRSSHRYKYENTVNDLGLAIFVYLESMKMVFTQDPMDPTSLEQFVKAQTLKFMGDTKVSIHELHRLLDKHTSNNKSKDAEKKRMAGDRCFDSLEWRNRPVVNPEGVRLQLNRVEAAIGAIYYMAVASLGKTLKTIDGEIERSHIELDVSNTSLDRVHQVLDEDVEEGLNHFKNQQRAKERSLIQRVWERISLNHKNC